MPRAPPSSRVVSFTADPTPAFDSGTDVMISPVAGAAVMPMPAPRTRERDGDDQVRRVGRQRRQDAEADGHDRQPERP